MAKRIVWTEQAKTDVRGIEQPIAMQILKTLGRYLLTGEGRTKQLKDVTPRPQGGLPLMGCAASMDHALCTTATARERANTRARSDRSMLSRL